MRPVVPGSCELTRCAVLHVRVSPCEAKLFVTAEVLVTVAFQVESLSPRAPPCSPPMSECCTSCTMSAVRRRCRCHVAWSVRKERAQLAANQLVWLALRDEEREMSEPLEELEAWLTRPSDLHTASVEPAAGRVQLQKVHAVAVLALAPRSRGGRCPWQMVLAQDKSGRQRARASCCCTADLATPTWTDDVACPTPTGGRERLQQRCVGSPLDPTSPEADPNMPERCTQGAALELVERTDRSPSAAAACESGWLHEGPSRSTEFPEELPT